jgi:hypothetical protein
MWVMVNSPRTTLALFYSKIAMSRRTRPVGQPTRGKTALNRLRQIDVFVALAYAEVLSSGSPLVVDVGYGAYAWTALEMRERWLPINPRLQLLGVEIDPERVAAAQPYAQPPTVTFALGGFNVTAVLGNQLAQVIRAYNVLRQYDEAAVPSALAQLARGLALGGLLIEGTSTPSGRMVAFDIYRQTPLGLQHEALVFGTNFRDWLTPTDFQTILPKRLIHHMREAVPATFFEAWQRALAVARGAGHTTPRPAWIAAAQRLRDGFGYPVDVRTRLLRRGYLVLHDALIDPTLSW